MSMPLLYQPIRPSLWKCNRSHIPSHPARKDQIHFLTFALLLVLSGCSPKDKTTISPPKPQGPLKVFAVNYPLTYFAKRIGGSKVEVNLPIPSGIDPAFWKPSANDISSFQQADLILLNGAQYAKWTQWAALPLSRQINTSEELKAQYLEIENELTHTHGSSGEHAHGTVAFTLWLNPRHAITQARAIASAFSHRLPEKKSDFDERFKKLEQELLDLDRRLEALVKKNPTTPLIGSHPVYQYLAQRYGLSIKSVHFEPNEAPQKEQWEAFLTLRKEQASNFMIWEKAPLKETQDRLLKMGCQSIVFDPCGNVPDQGDYMSVMRQNIENLGPVFSPSEAKAP